MKLYFERSFLRDLKKVKEGKVKASLEEVINALHEARALSKVSNVKKLKGHSTAYRIRIGEYRLGCFVEGDEVILTKFMHRKEIYKKFP